MNLGKKIRRISVEALQDVFDYEVNFPEGADTVIIIAPNGYGKTALLSLLKDCVSLNLRRAASHTFATLEITFQDGTKWKFERNVDEERARFRATRRPTISGSVEPEWVRHNGAFVASSWVSLRRYAASGEEVIESPPLLENLNSRILLRVLERVHFLSPESSTKIRDLREGKIIPIDEALTKYYHEIAADPSVRELLIAAAPSTVWSGVEAIKCVFIETQRLLYSTPTHKEDDRSAPQEEILRQAADLSNLLQQNYSDYAATSQALDRSFPNRLIARAREGTSPDADELKKALIAIEQQRAALTEAGILFEQADNIISTDDELLPKVVDALQIYVEDSQKKLKTYDEIFPKVSVFRELISSKLKPKTLSISRDRGASVSRNGTPLRLEGLSSGEKHEFIMLFKLIFETPSESLVLIDEPEISLHVVWQLEFMSDLRRIQSANPFQSIIATHSPQIFQGFKHLLVDLAD